MKPKMACLPGDTDPLPIRGFAALARADARVLVLGSMPGVASLRAQQYYGHPRNAFWPIMATVFDFDAAAPYAQRVAALLDHKVAVWDVLAGCQREGSLDADIATQSIEVNDFALFVRTHSGLQRLCFNGATAHSVFRRRVLPQLPQPLPFALLPLPSTSPANAAMPMAEKLRRWRRALEA